jgi:hypothetical protein
MLCPKLVLGHGLKLVILLLFTSFDAHSRATHLYTKAKNPQSNVMCKRMQQMVGNILRTLLHGEPPQDMAHTNKFINEALSIAMHAMRAAPHSTLGRSPGSLTFNRDMFLNIPLIADWHTITQRRDHLTNENLIRENQKRHRYDYVPQQRVFEKK